MKKTIAILMFSLLLYNCDSTKSIITDTEDIVFGNPEETDKDKLYDIKWIIPLETSDDCLIGEIDKIQFYNDRIYILDILLRKAVLVFDIDGNYLGRIGNTGRGPGEYILPVSFTIDERNDIITIYDNGTDKAISYQAGTFDFLSETKLEYHFIQSIWMENSLLAFFVPGSMKSPYEGQILIATPSYEVINNFAPSDHITRKGFSGINFIYKTKEGNYFFRPNEGIVFSFDESSYWERYRLKLHKNFPPNSFFPNTPEPSSQYYKRLRESEYVYSYQVMENDLYLIVNYTYKGEKFSGIYNKKSGGTFLTSASRITDNTNKMDMLIPVATYNDKFISAVRNPDNEYDNIILYIYNFRLK